MANPFFDTNILIDWLKDSPRAIAELSRHDNPRISRIVWAELLAGEPVETRGHVERLLLPFEIVEIDEAVAAVAADIRYLRRIKLLDAIILATAQANGAILITRNTKDFPADMVGIHVPYTLP